MELCSILFNGLGLYGKRILKGVDIYVCITESLCCTPEMNTTLKINYTSLKRFLNVCRPFIRVDSSHTMEASSPQHTACIVPVDASFTACLEDLHKGWRHPCTHSPGPFCSGGCGGCGEGHCLHEGAANMIQRRPLVAKSRSRKKRIHC